MARASLPPPSLLVHAVVLLAACFFFFLLFHPCCTAQANISAVEAAVRARASELLRDTTTNNRSHTSQLVDLLPLPANLTGGGAGVVVLRASALRVRTNALWADGVGVGVGVNATGLGFTVPPRVVAAPFARRVTIVFVRFAVAAAGNSTHSTEAAFAAPRRYALAAPVAGLLAYDATAGPDARVSLRALGAPVRVEFKDDLLLASSSSAAAAAAAEGRGGGFKFNATTARCVTFAATGEVVATHAVASGSACAVTGTGHFGIAVRLPDTAPPPPPAAAAASGGWWAWTTVGVGAGGVLGAGALALSVAGAVSWSRRRRREEMERRAVAGEELGRMTVRGSRMPSAKVVRTRPELEER